MLREIAGVGNGRQAHGEPNGDRRLVIAGGWLEVAVEMASVINVGTVLLRRPRAGMGVVGVLSPPPSRRAPTQLAPGSREARLRGAHSCAYRVVPVMAGGGWRGIALSMLVHFAAAKRKVAWHLSRVALRPGTGRSKMCLKQLYVLTVRGLYIH